MARHPEYVRLLGALKEDGYRVTAPRRALLRILAESTEPMSVQELHAHVNPDFDSADEESEEEINLVTVYRFANLLVEMGLVRRVEFGQGYARYEREESQAGPHHHHIVCRQCSRIEDFHGCDLQGLTAQLEGDTGFRIERHQLELYGVCPKCLENPVTDTRRTSGGRTVPVE